MRIAVVGAGIGGLVVAAGLQRDGHEVTVYERRQTPSAVGAGLTLFGNAFAALDRLGLGDAVRDVSSGVIASMRAGQREPSGSWLIGVPPAAVASMRSIHRVDLHRVLAEHLEAGTLKAGSAARVAGDGTPEVTTDAETQTFDLVVAADGIRSAARAALGFDRGVRYAGCTAWRGVTSRPVDLRGEAGETWGRGRLFGIVPLPDDRVYWFGTLNTPADTVFADEHGTVQRTFDGWHPIVQECIAATEPADVIRHDLYDLAELPPSFVHGRTVLLGDAAHAMTPNLGQGAGQAIEDAAVLTMLLRGTAESDLESILSRYDTVRRRRTRAIWKRSRMTGRIAQASHPITVALRNTALRVAPGSLLGAASQRLQDWSAPEA